MSRHPSAEREELINQTRQKLLEAAAAEFAQNGFVGANINQISLSAGFAKGTIYNYFPSKRALMLALIEEIAARHNAFISARVQEEEDPDGRLKAFFSAGYHFINQYPMQAQVAINVVFGHDQEFKEQIFQAYLPLFALIQGDIVEAGIEDGRFKSTDPDMTTALLMSLYLGSSSLYDPGRELWLDPDKVASFVMEGLA